MTNIGTRSEENVSGEDQAQARRVEAIRTGVLAALGSPAGLLRVSVLPLWGDKFRVNVWTDGSDGTAIPNSYFVVADDKGAILKAEPPLQKQY